MMQPVCKKEYSEHYVQNVRLMMMFIARDETINYSLCSESMQQAFPDRRGSVSEVPKNKPYGATRNQLTQVLVSTVDPGYLTSLGMDEPTRSQKYTEM
jgi:hypothetical protein